MSPPLPLDWYTNPDAFSHERRTLFAAAWQMIGRGDQLAVPGSYICANLAGWPVFVMRDAAGSLGAFRNACRHQNLPVLENGAGTAKLLRCRYHGWTYDFTGAFVTAPSMVAPPDPSAADHHLQRFSAVEWRGLALINPDPSAASPTASLDAVVPPDRLSLDHFHTDITSELACNWKTVVDHYFSARDGLLWYLPCLAFAPLDGGLIVHQIVPRTHLRSRIVHHLYTAADSDARSLAEAMTRAAAIVKAECEEGQARYQAGIVPAETPTGPALTAFRARLHAAHAQTSG